MPKIQFSAEWQSAGADAPEVRDTSAFLTIRVGDAVVTRNEDIWSKTVRDSVLVSTYPLAMWFAASWWRLNWEPLPKQGPRPPADWRMAHEMGAANHGYVWPHVVFASDNEVMQIWTTAPKPLYEQSVRYLAECSVPVPLRAFETGVDSFVDSVIKRLAAVDCGGSDLAQLWELVQADRNDPEASRYRKLEAALGYDPDDGPLDLMDEALSLDSEMGGASMAELAPLFGKFSSEHSFKVLNQLRDQPGINGAPRVPRLIDGVSGATEPPWARAVAAARDLRSQIGVPEGVVRNEVLFELLGLSKADANGEVGVPGRLGIGIPQSQGCMKFIPRKRHPLAKRFELSRFIGDLVQAGDVPQWLASTDLSTSRQKFQRAFAAEFLCPINSLAGFLDGDYSESSIEDAASHFDVSERTVESLLVNNGLIRGPWISDYVEVRPPYSLGADEYALCV